MKNLISLSVLLGAVQAFRLPSAPRSLLRLNAEGDKIDAPVLNKYSRIITEPPSQGASQAMLYATGLNPETMKSPQVRREIVLFCFF